MTPQYTLYHRYKNAEGQGLKVMGTVHVRTCGHYIVDSDFRDNPIRKNFFELFWCIRGSAIISSKVRATCSMIFQKIYNCLKENEISDLTYPDAVLQYVA